MAKRKKPDPGKEGIQPPRPGALTIIEAPPKRGPYVGYSKEGVDAILKSISLGETLTKTCQDENLPSMSAFLEWVADDRDGLQDRYARACALRMEVWADKIAFLAEDNRHDFTYDPATGKVAFNWDHIQRVRLKIDTMKWLMSKLNRKTFGESIEVDVKDDRSKQSNDELVGSLRSKIAMAAARTSVAEEPQEDES